MTRTPFQLAALASAAVPGLDPVAVGGFPVDPGASLDAALVEDTHGRTWLVRASTSAAGAVSLDAGAAAAALLAKRLGLAVPLSQGSVRLPGGGRAHVHLAIPGRGLRLAALDPQFPIARALGETIAAVHNLDSGLFEDAGLESYTPDAYRQRRLADLDRAASTGRVPANLLTRWEAALENVALWQWVPVAVHGGLEGRHVLVALGEDGAAQIQGVVGWRRAKVADPADDFAALVREAAPAAVVEVAKAYARARTTRPDRHMLTRAQLVAELGYVADLVDALAAGYPAVADEAGMRLTELADEVGDAPLVPAPRDPAPREPVAAADAAASSPDGELAERAPGTTGGPAPGTTGGPADGTAEDAAEAGPDPDGEASDASR